MPTYQYRCKSCSHEFEEIQKFADDPLVTCPSCHADSLVRVIGGAGLVFKGSGFYLTDYKNTSGKSETTSTTPAPEKKPEVKETGKPKDSAHSEPPKDSSAPKND